MRFTKAILAAAVLLPVAAFAQKAEDLTFTVVKENPITSIKNPLTGHIRCEQCDNIIIDANLKAPGDCIIDTFSNPQKSGAALA